MLAALAVLLAALLPTSAGAASIGPWGVAPAGSSTNRDVFDYIQPAGGQIHDDVAIYNLGDYPLVFDLYPTDAYNLPNGAFALRGQTDPRVDVGAWTTLPVSVVKVSPHDKALVPFTIVVPRNVTPGDHAGGIVALQRPVAAPAPGGSKVITRRGVGARIYLRVPGPLHSALAVTNVNVNANTGPFGGGNALITSNIANTGNTRLNAAVHVDITNIFGGTTNTFATVHLNNLLPGSRVAVVTPWRNLPIIGPYHVNVSVTTIGTSGQGGATIWILPWALLLILGVLIAVLIVWLIRRRRRRRAVGQDAEGPQPKEPVAVGEPA